MGFRIFVEKKTAFESTAPLLEALRQHTGIQSLARYRVYDIFGLSADAFPDQALEILADPVTDILHTTLALPARYFAVECLPGQYDPRADAAIQCFQLLGLDAISIKTAVLYTFAGVSDRGLQEIKDQLINPIESREKDLSLLALEALPESNPVPTITGFTRFDQSKRRDLHQTYGLSMDMADLAHVQNHFQSIGRDPTETELKVLDTYWSDHCRHSTFETEITAITIDSKFEKRIRQTLDYYLSLRESLAIQKPVRLMDLATIMGAQLNRRGRIDNLDISPEVNACSIAIDVDEDGQTEPWLLQFKNETHNHPTEVDPYGGASSCIGGAIRDPLSGRAFVFQAMRLSGSANPLANTPERAPAGKLPQKKITTEAAHGYSAYGNQIGLATSQVSEIYDEGYRAKRMEVGFVVGAVKRDWVRREAPGPGDVVLLLGGRTGRDGIGGASGSSKVRDNQALKALRAEVQKGNAPVGRKLQRLFRKEEVIRLIKRCNDLGAGGISVAIGEIAPGVRIDLDAVPVKYQGLNGTEIALSESQERLAVVVAAADAQRFIECAAAENLAATAVATVTERAQLALIWQGREIAVLDRRFLDTNGVHKRARACIADGMGDTPFTESQFTKAGYLNRLQALNHSSQKGLKEQFDASIGRGTVLFPLGGQTGDTPEDVSIQKIPTQGMTHTTSMAAWGFSPAVSRWSCYHGGYFAVLDSIAKIVAGGGYYPAIRLSFQSYYERLGTDPKNWGKPLGSLLGTIRAQRDFEIPAIGGKDSMSGSYRDMHVPPTLISFAVCPSLVQRATPATLPVESGYICAFIPAYDTDFLPDVKQLTTAYQNFHQRVKDGKIKAAMAVKAGGLAETLSSMAFGNEVGLRISTDLPLMKYLPGALVFQSREKPESADALHILGAAVPHSKTFVFNDIEVPISVVKQAWKAPLESIFPTQAPPAPKWDMPVGDRTKGPVTRRHFGRPRALITVFPGTNSEYDTAKAFCDACANTQEFVFCNLSAQSIAESIRRMRRAIKAAQIICIPGGFSAADEPDGSGKFIATVLRNPYIREEIQKSLIRGVLILGICNGFQALVRSGLLPYGEVRSLQADSPALTCNHIALHRSQMVRVRVVNADSPWLQGMKDREFTIPISHGEGRFVAGKKTLKDLIEMGQIATQYTTESGAVALARPQNPNGSLLGIEGITSPCGQVFGRMGHPERYEAGLMQNIPDVSYHDIFENGVAYFT
ncbi:MAG: phosphoribosylformylglycinamidine synthase [Flavobacteriales bacterium]